jgi:hypothetical protein
MSCDLPDEIPEGVARLKKLKRLCVAYSSWAGRKKELARMLPKGCEIDV